MKGRIIIRQNDFVVLIILPLNHSAIITHWQNNFCEVLMPIETKRNIKRITGQEFYEIDYQVTGLAFAIHNEFGRLWGKKIYQNELADRCREAGFADVETEVPIVVSHKDFCKEYSIDLLLQNAIVYELKTVSKLNSEHDKQALNYLFLLGLQHGKLINFRPASVEKRFVSTTVLPKDRYDLAFDDKHWLDIDKDSAELKALVIELLLDWGAFLETNLFFEAICHFRGGEEQVIKEIDVIRNGANKGKQKCPLLNQNTAFQLTAITKGIDNFEQHLNRFINLTRLDAIQWVNFNHRKISFKTIPNYKK
jgi:GxxExxY protein